MQATVRGAVSEKGMHVETFASLDEASGDGAALGKTDEVDLLVGEVGILAKGVTGRIDL